MSYEISDTTAVFGLVPQNPFIPIPIRWFGVLGDLNTCDLTDEISEDLQGLGGDRILESLSELAAPGDAFSFNIQGGAQNLDHIRATQNLYDVAMVDCVHVNVDFADAASDHEPIVALFDLNLLEGEELTGNNRGSAPIGGLGEDTHHGGAATTSCPVVSTTTA